MAAWQKPGEGTSMNAIQLRRCAHLVKCMLASGGRAESTCSLPALCMRPRASRRQPACKGCTRAAPPVVEGVDPVVQQLRAGEEHKDQGAGENNLKHPDALAACTHGGGGWEREMFTVASVRWIGGRVGEP